MAGMAEMVPLPSPSQVLAKKPAVVQLFKKFPAL
jgi:hypothetical protein